MHRGHTLSEETKIKIGNANKGRKMSEEFRKMVSIRMKGTKMSEKTKQNMSNAHKGKKKTPQHIINAALASGKARIGKAYPHMHRKMSNITKEKISINRKNKVIKEDHWNWKGGQTKEERNWQKNKRNRLKNAICKELGIHSFGDWELLKKQYNYICPCCHKSEPEIKLTEDHIIPLSKGGSDLIENIQPLCLKCNMIKHTKSARYNICLQKFKVNN